MFCPNCGNEVSDTAAFCGNCGQPVETTAAAPPVARRRGLVALGIYLGVILILALGAAGYFLWPDRADRAGATLNDGGETAVSVNPTRPTSTPSPNVLPTETIPPTETPSATQTQTASPTHTPTSSPTLPASHTPLPTPTLAATPTPSPTLHPGPETLEIGRSVNNLPIEAVRFGNGPQNLIFIGGLHAGFAPATVTLAQQTVAHLTQNPGLIPANLTVYVILSAGPDSPNAPGELRGRLNANGVDLNRNWECDWTADARWRGNVVRGSGGSTPFSEPETQSLRDFILEKQPVGVIFWEARVEDGLASPGNCGVRSQAAETLASTYGFAANYQIADFEVLTNQEVNGDGTNWLVQQGIPAIAVLLPEYTQTDWEANLAGVLAVLQSYTE